MEQRVSIEKTLPEVYKAMYNLSAVINKSDLTPIQKELISSAHRQINSIAFCPNMHNVDAFELGETQQRLFVLSAWRETDLFTPEKKPAGAYRRGYAHQRTRCFRCRPCLKASKYFSGSKL